MRDPAKLTDRENWTGGYYELALELDGRDDVRLRSVAETLWRVARVEGETSFDGFAHGEHSRGVVTLPSGARSVTRLYASRSLEDADEGERGPDWVCMGLPLGALERLDRRIGSFPFGDDGVETSLVWQTGLDEWLAGVAREVAAVWPFRLAVIGFEAVGGVSRDDLERHGLPEERPFALLVVGSTPGWFPATN